MPFTFIAGFSGLLGLVIGVIVSSLAIEEVRLYEKAFRALRNFFFLLAIGIAAYQGSFFASIVAVLAAALLLESFSDVALGNVIALIMAVLLVVVFTSPVNQIIAGLFLIIGLLEGGCWSSSHERFLKKYKLTKKTWKLLLTSYLPYVFLPLAAWVVLG